MHQKFVYILAVSVLICSLSGFGSALAQTTTFTYQGRLTDGGGVANGVYDIKFSLFDGSNNPQGSPSTITMDSPGVTVTNGLFAAQLDFGVTAFTGGTRFLEISARPHSADPNTPAYTTLSPRQQITSTPYAIRSSTSGIADTATTATSATTATNFSGSLSGDVTGTQGATVVSSVGGQTAANVASGASAANGATSANTANTIIKRDGSGNFSAGTITASLSGNAITATTASSVSPAAGDSVVTAINGSASSINTSHVTGDVELAPAAQQTATTANSLVNLKLIGVTTLGTSGTTDLLSLGASGTYSTGALNQEWFRVDNAGGVLARGTWDGTNDIVGAGTIPATGDGTRLMWYPAKGAFRVGFASGGVWDDANIGHGSFAAGANNRVSALNSWAFGNDNIVSGVQSGAFGKFNTVSGLNSYAFGNLNVLSGNNSLVNGSNNTVNSTAGSGSTALGINHTLGAAQNFAIGERATVTNSRALVVSLGNSFGVATNDAGANTLTVRAANGIFLGTNTGTPVIVAGHFIETSTGAFLTSGGVWTNASDRNLKENFVPVDGEALLRRLSKIPMTTWKYRVENSSVRHLGPMAQDFYSAFGLGDSDKAITTVDEGGVALAAAQALNARTAEQQTRIDAIGHQMLEKDKKIEGLQQQIKQQQSQIDGLKKLLCQDHPGADVCRENK